MEKLLDDHHAVQSTGRKTMNEPKNKITLFDNREVRQLWEDEAEKWWFSVVDVIAILSDQPSHERARKYWSVMKTRLKQEGAEPTTVCSQLKMQAHDGKMRLTDEWDKAGVQQGQEYAALTDLMSRVWSGISTREYKQHKGLKKENLRDNMTNTELVLNMLAEVATTDISQVRNPEGLAESAQVAKEGAKTAKAARQQLERSTGKPVVSKLNAKQLAAQQLESDFDKAIKVMGKKGGSHE